MSEPVADAAGPTTTLRGQARRLVEAAPFQRVVVGLILINAATLGMEVSPRIMNAYGDVVTAVAMVTIVSFVIELALRLFAYGFGFFRGAWNWFDLIVVAIALIPGSGPYSVLRVLRVTRLLSTVRSMRRVVAALVTTLPGMASIASLLAMVLYIFSVMATQLFGATSPDEFGTLSASALSMFQVTTGDDWANVIRPVTDAHPWSWAFFIFFIVIATYIVLNLFIAVAVEALERETEDALDDVETHLEETIEDSQAAILAELRAITARLDAWEARNPKVE